MTQTRPEPKVIIIPAKEETLQDQKKKKNLRVAAYCRVSTKKDEQLNSYENQRDYYTEKIMANPNWTMADIFADEGITGTSACKRKDFLRMIRQCRKGKIDMILAKSVSRFARNTVDTLSYTRELRSMGIPVIFEEQNINSIYPESEFLITIHGAFAQSESEGISSRVKWGKHQAMRTGKANIQYKTLLGYEKNPDGEMVVNAEQAETVRKIYELYLSGQTLRNIKEALETGGLKNTAGTTEWTTSNLRTILSDEKYCGDVLLQKTFIRDCISKQVIRNTGQLPMYLIQNHHEAIIPRERFDAVQMELARRRAQTGGTKKSAPTGMSRYSGKYALSGLLFCGECGTAYRRVVWTQHGEKRAVWRCSSRLDYNYLVSKSDEPLSRRVEENFNEYMEAILDQTECRFADRAEIAADLLDHESISKNLAASYIQRLDVKMKMLEMVKNKAFWPMLLDNDIVPPSNKNLFDYYMEFCAQDKTLDDHFAGMLKRNAEKIKWKWREMTDYLEIDEANILLKKLLCCDMLSTKEYRAVLQPIGAHPDSFSIAGLTEEYITVIIDLGFIRVTKGNLNFIRSHYPNQVTLFLMQKKGVDIVILAEQNEIELNDEEVREMLESSDLQIDIAIRLMKAYGRPISIENIECSDAICAAIVENNFNEDDIPWIFVNYDELKSLTKQAFLKTVKRYGQEVYDVARREERIPEAVYATMIQELDTEDLRDLREYLPNPDFEAVCTTNQKPKFSGTEENRVILDYFKKQEWISSYQKLTDGRYQAFSTQKKLIEA